MRRNWNPRALCAEIGTLVHCWWECNMVQLLFKTVWQFLKKLNRITTWSTFGCILEITESRDSQILYTNVHSNIIHNSKKVNKKRYPSTDEWIDKIWYIHIVKYYSTRKDIVIHTTTWMNLKNIMLSSINQTQKVKYCMIPLI